MNQPIPEGMLIAAGVSLVVAVLLTWIGRASWLSAGKISVWCLADCFIAQFAMSLLLITGTIQIVVRYFLADTISLPWTEEFARLILIWMVFWGATAAHRAQEHISMTVIYDMLPERGKYAAVMFADVLTIVVLAPIAWYGFVSAESISIMSAVSLGMPLSVFAYAVPIGCSIMVVLSAIRIARFKHASLPSTAAKVESA